MALARRLMVEQEEKAAQRARHYSQESMTHSKQ
jgi:hypothetical protein